MAWHGMTVEGSLTAHGTVSQSACTSGWLQAEPTTQEDWRSPPPAAVAQHQLGAISQH